MRVRRALCEIAAAVLCGAVAASAAASGAPAALADVIPMPAAVAPRPGAVAIRDGTEIFAPRGAQAARIAAYFADLMRTSHGLHLRVRTSDNHPARDGAIAFALDPQAPDAGPESYRLEVSPGLVVVSARGARGLFYGAVTLWQLCSAQPLRAGALLLSGVRIDDAPRFRWRGLMLDSARHLQSP